MRPLTRPEVHLRGARGLALVLLLSVYVLMLVEV